MQGISRNIRLLSQMRQWSRNLRNGADTFGSMSRKVPTLQKRVRKTLRTEEAIGNLIRELRLANNWTQEDLAAASDIDRTYVSLLERYQRDPSLSIVIQLARALNIPPGDFVDEVVKRMPSLQP